MGKTTGDAQKSKTRDGRGTNDNTRQPRQQTAKQKKKNKSRVKKKEKKGKAVDRSSQRLHAYTHIHTEAGAIPPPVVEDEVTWEQGDKIHVEQARVNAEG